MAGLTLSRPWRDLAIDLAIFGAIGLLMGTLGPYGTSVAPAGLRYGYWLVAIVGGGAIGLAAERLLGARMLSRWLRVLTVTVAMTPPVTVFILELNVLMLGGREASLPAYVRLLWQVFAIALAIMAVRALVWRDPVIETRTLVEPPLPEADAAFRRRLSAKRRTARLIAVEAHDHYLRVHTDAGSELVALRFADAIEELARSHGYRVHRSWWVAADAIESARWQRASGVIRLTSGIDVPVSRTYQPLLKQAGWL